MLWLVEPIKDVGTCIIYIYMYIYICVCVCVCVRRSEVNPTECM